jgi:hypothetical protein
MKKVLLIFVVISLVLTLVYGVASADVTNGLVAYYPFNGDASDQSGNGNDGTSYGGVSYAEGVIGEAAVFDGVDDYVRVDQSPTLNNLQTMTLTYWIKYYKPVSGPNDVSVSIANGAEKTDPVADGFYTHAHKSGINHYLGKWGDFVIVYVPIDATISLSEQPFTFVTFLVTEDRIRSYKNAEFMQEDCRNDKDISRPEEDWFIGCQDAAYRYFLNGYIDDLRIYNRALSDHEIWQLFSGDPGDIMIKEVTSNLMANPSPSESFRVTVHATWPEGITLHYRFFYRAGYGLDPETWGGNKWQLVRDWSPDNWVDFTLPSPGNYYLVGHVVAEGASWGFGDLQGGFNIIVEEQ